MAYFRATFEDIRMVLCFQGYQLNNQYVLREIGFWSTKICGAIPFNCKLNLSQIDSTSSKSIHIAESELHGIKLRKNFEFGLPSSDASAVIKCLYHLTKRDDFEADYIGVLKEENISSLIFKAGLGKFIFELDNLEILTRTNSKLPDIGEIKFIVASDAIKYKPCSMHDNLRNNQNPVCAKVKCEIVVNQLHRIQSNISAQIGSQATYQNNELFNLLQS